MKQSKLAVILLPTVIIVTFLVCNLILTSKFSSVSPLFYKRFSLNAPTFLEEILPLMDDIADRMENSYSNFNFEFNKFKSDSIGTFRELPDTRHPRCINNLYHTDDSEVSVIISFHNEAHSTLARTVLSVLAHTPRVLLREIILINDASIEGSDGTTLLKLPKVVLYKNDKREGLIRSRMFGVTKASGRFIMFLDSHCEVNTDWLQPLVDHVLMNPKSIASPLLDSIDAESFTYEQTTDHLKGGFDWNLKFKWVEQKREEDRISLPYPSPTVSGGLFLIEKSWFEKLGGFDRELEVWGTESLEISLKTWMCGGSIAFIPCSRVGHVFRKRHSFSFPLGNKHTYLRNAKRIAEVWMGEFKKLFYDQNPKTLDIEVGRLEEQKAVRNFLDCKPFKWYLENIYPELRGAGTENLAHGQIIQGASCLQVDRHNLQVIINACSQTSSSVWSLTTGEEVRADNFCLTALSNHVTLTKCTGDSTQKWTRKSRILKSAKTGLCLDNQLNKTVLSHCRPGAVSQAWDFSIELETY